MTKEFDKTQKAIKEQLLKDNSLMTDEVAETKSFEITNSQIKNTNEKYDEEGRMIVSENTKIYIEAGIGAIEE